MKPILFDKTDTTFTTQGLGRLSDAISCRVSEERNGAYELEMEYPIDGIHWSDVQVSRIIVAKPNDTSDLQAFRIYRISKPLKKQCMRGLDQNGNNTPTAQIYGTIYVPIVSAWFLSNVRSRYSDLSITYDTLWQTVLYKDYDESLLDYELVDSGADAVGDLIPTREPTNTIVYTFDGWATTVGGSVDPDALKNITEERSVYAHYAESTRYYTVRFFNGERLLDTQYIAYGGYAVYYDSDTGSNAPAYDGPGDPEDYRFTGWDQDVSLMLFPLYSYSTLLRSYPIVSSIFFVTSPFLTRSRTSSSVISLVISLALSAL